jgi:hypothetical protein
LLAQAAGVVGCGAAVTAQQLSPLTAGGTVPQAALQRTVHQQQRKALGREQWLHRDTSRPAGGKTGRQAVRTEIPRECGKITTAV